MIPFSSKEERILCGRAKSITVSTIIGPLARITVDIKTPRKTVDKTCQCRFALLKRKVITRTVYQNNLKIL
jgi:hypothetical protein